MTRYADLQIEDWLHELETDILARNADVGDMQHDCYIAASIEYRMNPEPNLGYVRQLLGHALNKPFATRN